MIIICAGIMSKPKAKEAHVAAQEIHDSKIQ
jgi:hypothetical protein